MTRTTYDSSNVTCFPEGFKMLLPEGYRIDTEYDDDWNEVIHLRGGFYYDEDGDEDFEFTCTFVTFNSEINDRARSIREGKLKESFVPGLVLDMLTDSVMEAQEETLGPGIRVNLSNSYPASTVVRFQNSISFFGIPLETYVVFYLVEINENVTFGFNTAYQSDPGLFYQRLLDVIKSIRVKGKKIETGNLTPQKLERALDERDSWKGVSFGIESAAGTGTDSKEKPKKKKETSMKLSYTTPEESLYPHYNSKRSIQGLDLSGLNAVVVVSEAGTEYQFFNLKDDLSEDASDETRKAVAKLNDKGAATYKLAEKAAQMRSVFRVTSDVFDAEHDKECELAEGLMRKAYMMSALRSFAWTLTTYCKNNQVKPSELKLPQIRKIIESVAGKEWLNFDDESVCKGLCGTQDLHVYYLPDKTPQSVKEVFLPSPEEVEQTKQIQEKFPNYNPILPQVGLLDALRKDLKYIYSPIKLIYEDLSKNRVCSKPLEGNDADILYAWCALAYAARGPFFSEDGPVSCSFTHLGTEEEKARKQKEASADAARKKRSIRGKISYRKSELEIESAALEKMESVGDTKEEKVKYIESILADRYERFHQQYPVDKSQKPEINKCIEEANRKLKDVKAEFERKKEPVFREMKRGSYSSYYDPALQAYSVPLMRLARKYIDDLARILDQLDERTRTFYDKGITASDLRKLVSVMETVFEEGEEVTISANGEFELVREGMSYSYRYSEDWKKKLDKMPEDIEEQDFQKMVAAKRSISENLKRAKAGYSRAEEQLQEAEAKSKETRSELEETERELEEANRQYGGKKEQILRDYDAAMTATQEKVFALKKRREEKMQENRDLDTAIAGLLPIAFSKKKKLRNEINANTSVIKQLQAEEEKLQKAIKEEEERKESQIRALDHEITELQSRITVLEKQTEAAPGRIQEAQENCKAEEENLAAAQKKADEFKANYLLETHEDLIADFPNQILQKKNRIEKLKTEISEFERELEELS